MANIAPQTSTGGNPDQVGVSQRITKQTLVGSTTPTQGSTHQQHQEHMRQPQVQQDGGKCGILRDPVGISQDKPQERSRWNRHAAGRQTEQPGHDQKQNQPVVELHVSIRMDYSIMRFGWNNSARASNPSTRRAVGRLIRSSLKGITFPFRTASSASQPGRAATLTASTPA